VYDRGRHVGDDRAVGSPGVGRRRPLLRMAALAALGASMVPAVVECGLDEKSLGAACVKGEDCLSGFCADQVCVAAPPLLDGEPPLGDGAIEASMEAAIDASKPLPDAHPDAHPDARVDAAGEGSDGPPEAASDHATTDVTTEKDSKGSGG
jgi:hypothetical protein